MERGHREREREKKTKKHTVLGNRKGVPITDVHTGRLISRSAVALARPSDAMLSRVESVPVTFPA